MVIFGHCVVTLPYFCRRRPARQKGKAEASSENAPSAYFFVVVVVADQEKLPICAMAYTVVYWYSYFQGTHLVFSRCTCKWCCPSWRSCWRCCGIRRRRCCRPRRRLRLLRPSPWSSPPAAALWPPTGTRRRSSDPQILHLLPDLLCVPGGPCLRSLCWQGSSNSSSSLSSKSARASPPCWRWRTCRSTGSPQSSGSTARRATPSSSLRRTRKTKGQLMLLLYL